MAKITVEGGGGVGGNRYAESLGGKSGENYFRKQGFEKFQYTVENPKKKKKIHSILRKGTCEKN